MAALPVIPALDKRKTLPCSTWFFLWATHFPTEIGIIAMHA